MNYTLETDRLLLRPFSSTDLDELAALYADPEVMRVWPRPFTRAETEAWLEQALARWDDPLIGMGALIYRPEQRFIGRCGLLRQVVEGREEIEIVYMVAREYWNRGLATEMARALMDTAFRELNLDRIIALIHQDNPASRRVARKLGMQPTLRVQHAGQPHDVYALSRNSWQQLSAPNT